MRRTHCRGCGSAHLVTACDFGLQPLAGNFPLAPEGKLPVSRYPLDLAVCTSCTLLQVTHIAPIDEIFHADYRYASSTVPALRRHFDDYAEWLATHAPRGARVLEFGCNDGILLERLSTRSFSCRGVDASGNMVELARSKGLKVDEAFFDRTYVERSGSVASYDVITCSNVYAHVDDLAGTTAAVALALVDGGLFCIEVHDGTTIAELNQFDTVYHEHLTYFTEASITLHLSGHGFDVERIDRTPMHGGALRVLARKSLEPRQVIPEPHIVASFDAGSIGQAVRQAIAQAQSDVGLLHREFGILWGYGAAGRAQMFINFTATSKLFSAVFDDSPLRQGRFIAGTSLPILPFAKQPHGGCCVILAWNYAEDISSRIKPHFDAVYTVLPSLRKW